MPASHRRALSAIAVQFFVNGVLFATLVPRLPRIRERLGVDLGELGLLLSLGAVAGLISSVVADRVIDRLGTTRVLILGPLTFATALAVIGHTTVPWMFVVALAAMQFGDAGTDIAMNLQGSRLSAERSVPVINRLHGLWSLGSVAGGLVAVAVIGLGVSVATHFTVAALALAGAVLLTSPWLPPDADGDPEPEGVPITGPMRALILFAVLGAAATVVELVPAEWAAFRLTEDLGTTKAVAGWGFVAITVGMLAGRLSGDFVSARLGAARLAAVGAALAFTAIVVASSSPPPGLVITAFGLAGLGISVVFPHLYDRAAQAPGPPGRALGAMTAGSRIAGLVTPAVVGGMADQEAFSVGGAVVAVTVLPAILLVAAHLRRAPR